MADLLGGIASKVSHQLTKTWLAGYDALRSVNPQFGYCRSDVVIASFPKSGRNWVRHLIANTMAASAGLDLDIHFRNSADWVSTTLPERPPVDGFPRFVATHDEYASQDTRVLYLLRHPADVMESYHHYLKYRWLEDVGEFSAFIRTEEHGIPAWRRHVESWEDEWDLLVRFEDLKEDAFGEVERMSQFFDLDVSEEAMRTGVERSTFERMRQLEDEYGIPEKTGANPDYQFMRKGEADKGQEYFDEADYRYLDKVAGDVMTRFGYEVPL
jgi:hypothetical protein